MIFKFSKIVGGIFKITLSVLLIVILLFLAFPFLLLGIGMVGSIGEPVSDDEIIRYLNNHKEELDILTTYKGANTISITDRETWLGLNSPTEPFLTAIIKLRKSQDFKDINRFIIDPGKNPYQKVYISFSDNGHWEHGFHSKALFYQSGWPETGPSNWYITGDTNQFMEEVKKEDIRPPGAHDMPYYRALGDGWYIEHSIYYGFDD